MADAFVDRVEREAIVALAKELIAIPSPSGDEQGVMEFVAGLCTARGLAHEVVALDPRRPNVGEVPCALHAQRAPGHRPITQPSWTAFRPSPTPSSHHPLWSCGPREVRAPSPTTIACRLTCRRTNS